VKIILTTVKYNGSLVRVKFFFNKWKICVF
jgi:hypothetical protein